MKFRKEREAAAKASNIMEGVEGFKMVGTNKKLEIKNTHRSEELFLAWDVFDYDGL